VTRVVGWGEFRYEVVEGWEQVPAGLEHPDAADIAIGEDDRVYVFNRGPRPVLVYDRDGVYRHGFGDGLFTNAGGMTISPQRTLLCTDDLAHFVMELSFDGQTLRTLGTPGVPSDTGDEGEYLWAKRSGPPFNCPTGVAYGSNGDLYVTDGYGNARVHCFSPAGELRFSWGEVGRRPGEFRIPHQIRATPDGRLIVADRENNRLQFFDLAGRFLEEWTDVARPNGVDIDADGNVYVAELGVWAGRAPQAELAPLRDEDPPSRVSIFSSDGELLSRWGEGTEPCAPGNFYAAHGIAVDSSGDIYVAEVNYSAGVKFDLLPASCHTLQKFARLPARETPA
jgi:DNA-binding beta-propeller fold protein YncE